MHPLRRSSPYSSRGLFVLGCLVATCFLLRFAPCPAGAEDPPARDASGAAEEQDAALESLESLVLVASAPREKRAVLRAEGELVLIRPGDPLPGIAGSEVESIGPEKIVARVDAFRQAWISTGGDSEIRVLDRRPPKRPPLSEPVWIVPEVDASEPSRSEEPAGSRGGGGR